MKRERRNTKNWKLSTGVNAGLALACIVFMSGCDSKSSSATSIYGDTGLCNVPLEANLNSTEPVRIGGSTTVVEPFTVDEEEWTLFNVSNELRISKVGMPENTPGLEVEGSIRDIEIVEEGGIRYALLAMGADGIAVVNITDPAAMTQTTSVKVSYEQTGITFAEGSGEVLTDNNISSTRAPISSLAIYEDSNATKQLLIGDEGYGLHKTVLSNLLGATPILEDDGTLKIDTEAYTLQYAGENAWGGPKSLIFHGEGNNTRLFVAQGYMGIGIFDPETLEQVGRYNLYTDATENNGGEDWFINMNVATEVQTGNIDECTGLPNYEQVKFEIQEVWKADVDAPTPWADFERYGKFYYDARKIDVETFDNNKTIAYIAYGLGGMVAVDVTGYETAKPREDCTIPNADFLEGKYLGYVPALPAHGPKEETGITTQSLLPYTGAGMLKESGVSDVKVDTASKNVYFSDHFAGLMVIGNADNPAVHWKAGTFNNNTSGELGDHWPDYEFVTSYDMTPITPTDSDEEFPAFIYDAPILLVTGEVSGHGNALALTSTFDQITSNTEADVILAAGGGGLSFVDIFGAPTTPYDFAVLKHFATTDEIGADENGVATEGIINIGHSEGVTAYGNLLFLADGPHGMSVWNIADENCVPTDDVHLVANTLQSEYPIGDINPTPHAHAVVLDTATESALVMSQSLGVRRVNTDNTGEVGVPVLLHPEGTDIFEHNLDTGNVVDFLHMQDHAYGAALKGSLLFTADGSNGMTVYDLSKDPTDPASGYVVSNIGGDTNSQPDLGRVSDVKLWDDISTGKSYAFVAAGSRGVGVVDVTSEHNMTLVKVFEPIKLEEGKVGKADGKSNAVEIIGDHVFFSYDSFGVVAYSIADMISPLIPGTDPTEIWGKNIEVDQRPVFAARFKLQDPVLWFGSAELTEWSGGAVGMDSVTVNGKNFLYVAYGEAGVIKIDWTNPAAPVLLEHADTVGEAADVSVVNGRVYVADGSGGLVLLK